LITEDVLKLVAAFDDTGFCTSDGLGVLAIYDVLKVVLTSDDTVLETSAVEVILSLIVSMDFWKVEE
jgi:hypothetical protein